MPSPRAMALSTSAALLSPVGRHPTPFQAAARRGRAPQARRPAAQPRAGGPAADEPPPPASGGAESAAGRGPLSARALDMHASSAEQQRGTGSASAAAAAAAASQAEEAAALGGWATRYREQGGGAADVAAAVAGAADGPASSSAAGEPFLLPLMTLTKAKLPTESVPLQIFEPRYRLMFKLCNQSRSRRFGVVLADKSSGLMESVGALCELTHFITVPERRRLFINARVVGRFSTQQVVADKPFVTVVATQYQDEQPQDLAQQLQLATLETRVWQTMQEVRELASKLFAKGRQQLGNEIFSLEVRRWCPDESARKEVPTAPGADPTLMRMVEMAGLLGEEGTVAERTTEYVCSDALRSVSDAERRERFSFAVSRTLEFSPAQQQELLYLQDTAERLRQAEALILEGRNYLAARSTLKDMF